MNDLSVTIYSVYGDEYRVVLPPAPKDALSEQVNDYLSKHKIEIKEIIVGRTKGNRTTSQKELHQISSWIADRFAENPNMILFYICDDMNPIPSRNSKSVNSRISVQEYRSKLFSYLFNTYISSHNISGVFNYPIQIDGEGYSYYIHIIARRKHAEFVQLIGKDVIEGFGK